MEISYLCTILHQIDMTSIVLVEDIKSYHISAISILTLQMAVDKDCRIVHAFCPYISSRDNAPT